MFMGVYLTLRSHHSLHESVLKPANTNNFVFKIYNFVCNRLAFYNYLEHMDASEW
jgi:hypothetical protein